MLLQFLNLSRNDNPAAAAAEYLDMRAIMFPQHIDHVFEIFNMPALVRTHGNAVHIFLQGCADDLVHRTVMAQVDDLGPGLLQYAPDNIDGSIMPVKQAGGGDKT